MNAFADITRLASDIAEYEAFERFRDQRPDLPPVESRQKRLAITLKSELLNAGALIAAATSLVNAIESGSARHRAARTLTVFVPAPSNTVTRTIDALFAENIDIAAHQHLLSYCARISLAQRLSASFAATVTEADDSPQIDAEILSDAWRRTCTAAASSIDVLNTIIADPAAPTDFYELRVLELLHEAAQGGSPCLEADGRMSIPGWAEKRREARQPLMQHASASIGATEHPVTIRDVSRSGLGLQLLHTVAPGERLTVRLTNGREIVGEIVWSDGERAGIRLDRRLVPTDPLLARPATRPPRILGDK